MALDPVEVGARMRQAREAKGLTHQAFADLMSDKLGRRINLRTVQRWQKGQLPRLGTLMAVADALEVPQSYFVETEAEREEANLDRLNEQVAEVLAGIRELLGRVDPADPADPEPLEGERG